MYEGKKAFVKILKTSQPANTHQAIENEVRCLMAVDQFYTWGHSRDSSQYYIVMPNMGVTASMAQQTTDHRLPAMNPNQLTRQAIELEKEYEKKYRISHG
ncbi:hypothetical protein H0H92_007815, partial [Tricholoma furcatifolium]